jgi:hypothetical protein
MPKDLSENAQLTNIKNKNLELHHATVYIIFITGYGYELCGCSDW